MVVRNYGKGVPEPTRRDVDRILGEMLFVDDDMLTPDAKLCDDLNVDSLDLAELVVALEDVFDVALTDEQAKEWVTVRDVYAAVGLEVDRG